VSAKECGFSSPVDGLRIHTAQHTTALWKAAAAAAIKVSVETKKAIKIKIVFVRVVLVVFLVV
jgi:hypothetical protein